MIRELTKKDEWIEAFPLMKELRTHLDQDTYLSLLEEMRPQGYRLFALEEQEQRLLQLGGFEPERPPPALVGDPTLAIDQIEPRRHPAVTGTDGII